MIERYGELVDELVPVLRELEVIDREISNVRSSAKEAGRGEELPAGPNYEARPWNRPLYEVVVLAPASADGPHWRSEGWRREHHPPEIAVGGPKQQAGVYDQDGNPIQASGRVKVTQTHPQLESTVGG